jgi:hypothetical protein
MWKLFTKKRRKLLQKYDRGKTFIPRGLFILLDHFMKKQLIDKMMKLKPVNGHSEDFWVFSIVRDDPALPTYEERVTMFGTYEECVESCVLMVERLVTAGVPSGRVESYHGDAARDYLLGIGQYERKYQEERKAQPCN